MSDKHTPGPWHWDDAVWEAYDPLERAPWLIPTNNDKGFVLMGEIKCNSKADARLIAAAPELLEALEEIASYPDLDALEFKRIARAALAKARGET